MFINLASDRIVLSSWQESDIFPFRNIDKELSSHLVSAYTTTHPSTIFVITGPWSFTNVRVGVLALKSLSYLSESAFDVYAIDKFSIYASLFAEGYVPRYGIIFVGQRKNLAVRDAHDGSYTLLSYEHIIATLDQGSELWSQKGSFFVDYLVADDFPIFVWDDDAVSFSYDSWSVFLSYQKKTINISSCFQKTDNLSPFYAIDATL